MVELVKHPCYAHTDWKQRDLDLDPNYLNQEPYGLGELFTITKS